MTIEGHYFLRVTRDADAGSCGYRSRRPVEALRKVAPNAAVVGEVVRLEVANEMPD